MNVMLLLNHCQKYVLIIVFINLSGCLETDMPSSELVTDGGQTLLTLDVGDIRIDAGTVIVTRTFEVKNSTSSRITIDEVRKSCACVNWELGSRELAQDETTTIKVSLKVDKPGINGQSLWLISQEEIFKKIDMVATGVYQQDFQVIVESFGINPETLQMQVNLYMSDSGGQEETETPTILEPEGVSITEFGKWLIIERTELNSGRLTRQVASATLDFNRYNGIYPVDLTIKSGGGSIATLSIQAPWTP